MIDSEKSRQIRIQVEENAEAIIQFLREIVAIPSMEGKIRVVGERVAREMERLGFEEIRFDRRGNILGRIGAGPVCLIYDSHIDTVGIGAPAEWKWDPFRGKVDSGILYGRGACDEKGSTPGVVYGLSIARSLGLLEGVSAYYFGNMEEWCDGIAPHELEYVCPPKRIEPRLEAVERAIGKGIQAHPLGA